MLNFYLKVYDIGDLMNQRERVSLLDSCSRFGNVFVGRQNGFDVYCQTSLENSEGNGMDIRTNGKIMR